MNGFFMRIIPFSLALLAALLLAGCGAQPINPTALPTAASLPSVTPTPQPTATFTPSPEPPSATPLPTQTAAPTLTETPAPTQTFSAAAILATTVLPPTATTAFTWTPVPSSTSIPYLTPTPFPYTPPGGQPIAGPAGAAAGQPAPRDAAGNCLYPWFFHSRTPGSCAAGAPITAQAAFLAFETGLMFWFSADPAIYVLYYDSQVPRWQRYADTWQEGMPERDPLIVGPQGLWQQPRRGFGLVWRQNPMVRTRLGWALHEWETQYDATIQQAGAEGGGALYVLGPDGRAYQLYGDLSGWEIFSP